MERREATSSRRSKRPAWASSTSDLRDGRCRALPPNREFSFESKLFGGCHPCSRATSATLETVPNIQVFFHLAALVHFSIETDQNLELHNTSLFILECPSLLSVYCALPQSDTLHISIYLPKLNFFSQKYFISFPSPSFSPP